MGGHQSRLASLPSSDERRKLEKSGVQSQHEFENEIAEDTDLDTLDVVLSRRDVEAWGFAWNVGAHASQRLVVVGVDPMSPAGRWNSAQQESGLRPICRGDELLEVNGVSAHDAMRRELVAALVARLLFRRPIQEEEELAAAVTAAALARQRRAARERSAAALADSSLWLSSNERPKRAERTPRQSVCVKNTFIHMKCDSDPGDDGARTPDSELSRCPEGQLSLSDPLPRPQGKGHMSPSKLSDSGGQSDDSFASALSGISKVSQSSGERRPSSREGESCPSTDWEFQAYQGYAEQASGNQDRNQWHVQPGHVVHASTPAMVPVLVPVVGVQPGQPVFAMQHVAAGIGVPMGIPLPGCRSDMPSCELQGAARPEGTSATRATPEHAPPPPNYHPFAQSRKQARQHVPLIPAPAYQPDQEGNTEEAAQHACSAAPNRRRCEATTLSGPPAPEQHRVEEQLSSDTGLADINEHSQTGHAAAEPRKKKPTRRGGKRARHRPCHVAAAASDWASSIGSLETPSFGDLGSGEEAEGEADSEAEVQVDLHPGNPLISRSIPEAPSVNRTPAKRSFYPPAGRLKVAGGLAPLADRVCGRDREVLEETRSRSVEETRSVRENTKAEAEVLRFKNDCPTFGRSLDTSSLIMRASPISSEGGSKEFGNEAEDSHGEAIDEVEPEPASASDLSDPPSTMACTAQKAQPSVELAFATATTASLGVSPVGTASTATAPKGWPLPACALAKDSAKCPEIVEDCSSEQPGDASEAIVGRRAQVVGLVRTPEYNGQWGQVQDFDPNLGRYNVQLLASDGPPVIVKLRRENLHIPKAVFLRFENDAKSDKLHQFTRAASGAAVHVVGKAEDREKGWRPTLRLTEK